jgi:hypothetical protein
MPRPSSGTISHHIHYVTPNGVDDVLVDRSRYDSDKAHQRLAFACRSGFSEKPKELETQPIAHACTGLVRRPVRVQHTRGGEFSVPGPHREQCSGFLGIALIGCCL